MQVHVMPSMELPAWWALADSWFVSDSVAALMAAGVERAGEAVSSLGSTLAIDLLSTHPIDAARYGICSYHWKERWIVGRYALDHYTDSQLLVGFCADSIMVIIVYHSKLNMVRDCCVTGERFAALYGLYCHSSAVMAAQMVAPTPEAQS